VLLAILTEETVRPEHMMSIATDTSFWGLRRSGYQIPAVLNSVGIVKCPFLGTAKTWDCGAVMLALTIPAGPGLLQARGRRSGKHCSLS